MLLLDLVRKRMEVGVLLCFIYFYNYTFNRWEILHVTWFCEVYLLIQKDGIFFKCEISLFLNHYIQTTFSTLNCRIYREMQGHTEMINKVLNWSTARTKNSRIFCRIVSVMQKKKVRKNVNWTKCFVNLYVLFSGRG